jgi:hypothetical protein
LESLTFRKAIINQRYWLFRRDKGFYYLEDSQTGKRRSLRTTDRRQAERVRDAEKHAVEQPMLNLALGRTYLAAIDPALTRHTWQIVIDEFRARGKDRLLLFGSELGGARLA